MSPENSNGAAHFRIKNWHQFQHFKDRRPPWIKLYRDILDDIEWHELEPLSAKRLVMLWLIASENEGMVPSVKQLCFRLRCSEKDVIHLLSTLSHWLEQVDISAISPGYQDDITSREEKSRDREETETESSEPSAPRPQMCSVTLPLNDNSEFSIPESLVTEWKKLYPATDPLQELRKMRGWLLGNPTKKKTKNGVMRFCTSWLSKAQDRGGVSIPLPKQEQPRLAIDEVRRQLQEK